MKSWRNHLAYRLASTALLLADRHYRAMLKGAWQYGLAAAVRDARDGRRAPDHWTTEAARP